jgi:glycosyltransferase involved in cell wall biosynthesis
MRSLQQIALEFTVAGKVSGMMKRDDGPAAAARWRPARYARRAMTRESSRKIRVLLIAPSLAFVGGQSIQAAQLLEQWKSDPEVHVDFQPLDSPLPKWLKQIPYARTVAGFILFCLHLLWRIPRYDVIHTFTAGLWSFALWTIPTVHIGRMYGRKVLVNYHDGRAEQHLQSWRIAKPTLLASAAVVTPSDYLVDVFSRYGIPSRRIYNIIDVAAIRFRARRSLRPVLMTNRALEPLYNVACVLRAFAIVQQRYPEATLTVAHDGPCRRELEQQARDLGLRNARFVGAIPKREIAGLYDAADIYIMSPNIDCMPLTLLECFAAGLPAVSTSPGGVPYIVTHGETGLLADVNDHAGLADQVFRLLEDPAFVERLTQTAHAELDKYRWIHIRHEWVEVYRELAGRPQVSGPASSPTIPQRLGV